MGASERDGLRVGQIPCWIEVVTFVWLFSQATVEITQVINTTSSIKLGALLYNQS